jgi:hypothetical protein
MTPTGYLLLALACAALITVGFGLGWLIFRLLFGR